MLPTLPEPIKILRLSLERLISSANNGNKIISYENNIRYCTQPRLIHIRPPVYRAIRYVHYGILQ